MVVRSVVRAGLSDYSEFRCQNPFGFSGGLDKIWEKSEKGRS